MLTNTRPHQPLAPVLPSASNDHFRYPWFHFCYPFEPLRFLLFPCRGGLLAARQCDTTAGAGASGSVNVNVLPSPGVLVTQMRPPCASMIPFAMASPSPAPRRTV